MTKDNSTGKNKDFYDLGKKKFDQIRMLPEHQAIPQIPQERSSKYMTEEDEEFQRLEREAKMRALEDDDTQVYKKTWVGLTDEEIWSTVGRIGTADSDVNPYQILNDARAIEQRLKEKNT